MNIINSIKRLNLALERNRVITERATPPVEKAGDKKDDRDTFSADSLPDELQSNST